MKPCKHGKHPFSYCKECCRDMQEQVDEDKELLEIFYGQLNEVDKLNSEYGIIGMTGSIAWIAQMKRKLGSDRNAVLDEAIKAANGVDALFYNRAKVGEAIEALKEKDDD